MILFVIAGEYSSEFRAESDWFHLTVVYHGPEVGFTLYIDGKSLIPSGDKTEGVFREGYGRLEIGRGTQYDEHDELPTVYNSVCVDKLMMWSRELSEVEIKDLYEVY